MFVDAPSFPIADRAEDMDNATLARRALLDVNSARHAEGMGVAPYWDPTAVPGKGFLLCLVGRTAGDVYLALELTERDEYRDPLRPYVKEVEWRFEGWRRRSLSAEDAARATGWSG